MTEEPTTKEPERRSALSVVDLLRLATIGFKIRLGRSLLTSVGIAVGVGSLVAVVGLSSSSREDLVQQIEDLGTNLLSVQPGQDFRGGSVGLPPGAPDRIRRIAPVLAASSVDLVDGRVQRSAFDTEPNAITIAAVEPDLFDTLRASTRVGSTFDAARGRLPVVVLGATAAERLGLRHLDVPLAIDVDGETRDLIGILDPLPLAEVLDAAAFIGLDSIPDDPTRETAADIIYLRTLSASVLDVRDVLAAAANPTQPFGVAVQRPSDALEARAEVDVGLRNLLLALGAVALTVGAIGIANVMVISVLERHGEIGLRRSIGAKRRHIVAQFVTESALLSLVGGLAGVVLGTAATVFVARRQGWAVAIPWTEMLAAIAISIVVGIVAGIYPAARAALLDPAQAVRPGS